MFHHVVVVALCSGSMQLTVNFRGGLGRVILDINVAKAIEHALLFSTLQCRDRKLLYLILNKVEYVVANFIMISETL